MSECEKTREFCLRLESVGAYIFPIVAHKRQQPGWPDRYISHVLWHGFVEFKDWKTPVQLNQRLRLREMNRRQPGSAWVARFSEVGYGIDLEDPNGVVIASCDSDDPKTFLSLCGMKR
jgi:hypothetical protein